jgi:hypothetical protein
MPIQYTSNYQFNAPTDAAGVSVTPSGTAGVDSAWVTVFTAGADSVLTSVILFNPGVTATFRVDVGVDTGGGETVIASHGGVVSSTSGVGWGHLPFRIPIDAIPNGAAVKVRMAKSGTNTTAWFWALQYYQKPIVGTLLTTANPQLITAIIPPVNIPSATSAWVNSGWTTVFTPGADAVISGYIHNFVTTGEDYIFEIGQNSAVLFTIKDRSGLADHCLFRDIKHPLTVEGGVAVQGRWRKLSPTLRNLPTAFTYYELPL